MPVELPAGVVSAAGVDVVARSVTVKPSGPNTPDPAAANGGVSVAGPIIIVKSTYWLPSPTGGDDGPMVQAVLNSYALAGNPSLKVVSRAECYKFATGVTVPQIGATNRTLAVEFEGTGYMQDGFFTTKEGTIWLANGLVGDLLTTPSATCFSFVGIENMTFSAMAALGGSQTAGALIHLYALQEGWIRDVEVQYAFADGIRNASLRR